MNKKKKEYQDFIRNIEASDEYRVAQAIYDFVEDLHAATVEKGMTYAQLAANLGKSPSYVTQVMRGDYNLTIATMVSLARAVGYRLDIQLQKILAENVMQFTLPIAPKPEILPHFNFKEENSVESTTPAA